MCDACLVATGVDAGAAAAAVPSAAGAGAAADMWLQQALLHQRWLNQLQAVITAQRGTRTHAQRVSQAAPFAVRHIHRAIILQSRCLCIAARAAELVDAECVAYLR